MIMNSIASKLVGYRKISGTEFPVENLVYRNSTTGGAVHWSVAFGVCNGIAASSRRYKTKKDALEAAGV